VGMMKLRDAGIAAFGVTLAGVLVAPTAAASPAGPFVSIARNAHLGLEGASAVLSVRYRCDDGVSSELTASLAQAAGRRRLARATGSQAPLLCDGATHATRVLVDGNTITFTKGKAAASATLVENLPDASRITVTAGPTRVYLKT